MVPQGKHRVNGEGEAEVLLGAVLQMEGRHEFLQQDLAALVQLSHTSSVKFNVKIYRQRPLIPLQQVVYRQLHLYRPGGTAQMAQKGQIIQPGHLGIEPILPEVPAKPGEVFLRDGKLPLHQLFQALWRKLPIPGVAGNILHWRKLPISGVPGNILHGGQEVQQVHNPPHGSGDNVVRVSRMGDKDDAGLLINGRQEEILKTQSGILRPGKHIPGLCGLVFSHWF